MKPLILLTASALALTAAACGPQVPPARAALDCPAKQGDLTRTSASPDGKACTYATSGGAEVTLELVSTPGGPDQALANIETTLIASTAAAAEAKAGAKGVAEADKTSLDQIADARANATSKAQADKAIAEAEADAQDTEVNVTVSKDGKTTTSSGTTHVNLPGIHIVANDHNDTANVKIGPLTVDAGDDRATIRVRRDVRLRGEALNPKRRGMRATFIYTGDGLPQGYRFVGYEAAGPKAGPLTVAIVKSKTDGPDGSDIYPDVKRLVRLNGGV